MFRRVLVRIVLKLPQKAYFDNFQQVNSTLIFNEGTQLGLPT